MEKIRNLITFHRIPKSGLARALDMTLYQLERRIYRDEIEFSTETAQLFSIYLAENHGVRIDSEQLKEYSRAIYNYRLEPHGKWLNRPYLETKEGYEFDPRIRAQDLIASVGLPIIATSEELGISYPRLLKPRLLELEELDKVCRMVYNETGNLYHVLDIASRFIPLDKIVF